MLFESARETAAKQRIRKKIARLERGQCINMSMAFLKLEITGYYHNGAFFSPPDIVLEGIMGAAYEFCYVIHPSGDTVTFKRLAKPLETPTAYISPDRREGRSYG